MSGDAPGRRGGTGCRTLRSCDSPDTLELPRAPSDCEVVRAADLVSQIVRELGVGEKRFKHREGHGGPTRSGPRRPRLFGLLSLSGDYEKSLADIPKNLFNVAQTLRGETTSALFL